jgi:putative transposase
VSERAQIGRVLTVERPAWPKALIARLVGVSRQSLYHREPVESVEPVEPVDDGVGGVGGVVVRGPWRDRRPALSDDLVIEAHILDVCRDRPRFGTRRVTAMVRRRLGGSGAARGVVNRKRVQRVMREHGLLVPQRRIPRGEHAGTIQTDRCDQVWATDLSKIATREGWLWIVGVIDCHDRDLIGHRYGVTADTTLCLGALHDGVCERFNDDLDALKAAAPQLSHDWGSQFTSRRYNAELSTLGIRSRPTMIDSPEQNGIMERFFGSMKDEEVWTTEYDTRAQAIAALDAWIDDYRTERPHQSLGYLTPAEYRTAMLGSTCATQAA